ncbi:RNA recognition motif domain-containing protein [Ditylenchus destructor]|nr:RNA recognition motif domain-containing protein [Ditylenchus destructor]
MFSLRIALQKCVRRASILGNSQICHQTSRSSIHISRLTYSNGNSEETESASISSLKDHQIKSSPNIVNNPKAGETPSITKNKALNTTQSSKNLEFRRYHILVTGFSEKFTHAKLSDELQEFYSRFGEIVRCTVGYNARNNRREGIVVFSSKQAKVKAQIGAEYIELNLRVQNLSPETTEESLRDFYSKFGRLTQCLLNKYPDRGQSPIGYITFASQAEMNRALDAQPHLIDENISRATLYSIFDKFGKVIRIEVREDGEMDQIGSFILIFYGTKEEADKALNAGPNEINGVTYYVKRAKERIEYGRKENDRNH